MAGRPGRRCCCPLDGYTAPLLVSCPIGYSGAPGPNFHDDGEHNYSVSYSGLFGQPTGASFHDGTPPTLLPLGLIHDPTFAEPWFVGEANSYGSTNLPANQATQDAFNQHRPRDITLTSGQAVFGPPGVDWYNTTYFNANIYPMTYGLLLDLEQRWEIPKNPKKIVVNFGTVSVTSDNSGARARIDIDGYDGTLANSIPVVLTPDPTPFPSTVNAVFTYDRIGDHTSDQYTMTYPGPIGPQTRTVTLACLISMRLAITQTVDVPLVDFSGFISPPPESNNATITATWSQFSITIGTGAETNVDIGFNGWTADTGSSFTKAGSTWTFNNGSAATTVHPAGIRKEYTNLDADGLYRIVVDGPAIVDVNGSQATQISTTWRNAVYNGTATSAPRGFSFRANGTSDVIRILGNADGNPHSTGIITHYGLTKIEE